MKILMLAYECNPEWPSLPVVAYKYALALGKEVELTVITQEINRPAIEKAGSKGVNFKFINMEFTARPFYLLGKLLRGGDKLGWTTQVILTYPSYILFELIVWWKYRKEIKSGEFDIIHRSTPMTQTLPSPIALAKTDFVIGPLNGGLDWPEHYKHLGKREREWLRPLRKVSHFAPFYNSTFKKAACILAAFKHTISDIPKKYSDKTIDFPEVGIDPELFTKQAKSTKDQKRNNAPLTILFASRIVPLKLPDVILSAYLQSDILRHHKLVFVGDGPMREGLEKRANKQQLDNKVIFKGWLSQKEVGETMKEADIFVFPSVKDLGAGALIEAMACDLACVAIDYGAATNIIDSERGVKIPVLPQQDLIKRYQQALEELVDNPEKIKRISQNGRDFVLNNLTWDAKAKKTVEVYKWVKDPDNNPKPIFWH